MPSPHILTRRTALARLAVLLGGTIVGGDLFLRGETLPRTGPGYAPGARDLALLDEIGETIIPATHIPGAKAVGIGAFMAMMVDTCYDPAHQAVFQSGLAQLDARCTSMFGRDFLTATPSERTTLLQELDREQHAHAQTAASTEPAHYFRLMKQLTILGYFTSEIGATQALRFVEVPGRYDGAVPYQKGDRAWFTPPGRTI